MPGSSASRLGLAGESPSRCVHSPCMGTSSSAPHDPLTSRPPRRPPGTPSCKVPQREGASGPPRKNFSAQPGPPFRPQSESEAFRSLHGCRRRCRPVQAEFLEWASPSLQPLNPSCFAHEACCQKVATTDFRCSVAKRATSQHSTISGLPIHVLAIAIACGLRTDSKRQGPGTRLDPSLLHSIGKQHSATAELKCRSYAHSHNALSHSHAKIELVLLRSQTRRLGAGRHRRVRCPPAPVDSVHA